MDITSSINAAITRFQHNEQMSVRSGDDNTRNQVRHHQSQSSSMGRSGGVPVLDHGHGPKSPVDSIRNAVHNAVAYDRSERGTLQLRTQEGDVVRIKFVNSESSSAQNQQFDNGGSLLANFSMEGNNESKFKVVVEGDLNGEELTAIRQVLVQAREMANTFFDGDVKAAFESASDFKIDSEQLANVNMKLSLSETYTYARSVIDSQDAHTPGVVPPGDQVLSVTPETGVTPGVVPVSTSSLPNDLAATLSPPTLNAVAPDTSSVQTSAVDPASDHLPPSPTHVAPDPVENLATALSTITDFLNQLSATLNEFGQQFQGPGSQSVFSISAGFQLQVVSSLMSQMEPKSAEREFAGHSLAAATVDEMAMKMDAHVNDVA